MVKLASLLFVGLAPVLQAQIVYDVNTTPVSDLVLIENGMGVGVPGWGSLQPLNNGWLMSLDSKAFGREAWFTDGTQAGTQLLIDANVGPFSSDPGPFTPFKGGALFGATRGDGHHGLFFTDGTAAGTQLVKAFPGGKFDGAVEEIEVLGDLAFFRDRSSVEGFELWVTDGTEAGTLQLTTGPAGYFGTYPRSLTPLPNGAGICFLGTDKAHGAELWVSDGTVAGTHVLLEFVPGSAGTNLSHLRPWNGKLLFAATYDGHADFYSTDGTVQGTRFVAPLASLVTTVYVDLDTAIELQGALYLRINWNDGAGPGLYRFDGTSVTQVVPAIGEAPHNVQPLEDAGTAFFFFADSSFGHELWTSDGTAAGTHLVKDIAPGASNGIEPFTHVPLFAAGKVWFTGRGDGKTDRLWVTDGTEAGTLDVTPPGIGPFKDRARNVTEVDATRVLFAAETDLEGPGLWTTNGALQGMQLVVTEPGGGTQTSSPGNLVSLDGEALVFVADDGIHGRELYGWDPVAGLHLIADLRPGPAGSAPSNLMAAWCGDRMRVFFTATTDAEGREVWATDGTTAGTQLLVDAVPGSGNGVPAVVDFESFGDRVAFVVNPTPGRLFVSDGTPTGTQVHVKGTASEGLSTSWELGALGGRLLFTRKSSSQFTKLWITDGAAPPQPLAGFDGLPPENFARFEDQLVFAGSSFLTGTEPWITDGTPEGTRLLFDLQEGTGSSDPSDFTVHDGELYFLASQASTGRELWKLPSASAPAVLMSDMDAIGVEYRNLTSTGAGLYFERRVASEPWKLGRTLGVPMDVVQLGVGGGVVASDPGALFGVGKGVLLGTQPTGAAMHLQLVAGGVTTPVADYPAGAPEPSDFVVVGSRLFFTAFHGQYGSEVMSIELPSAVAVELGGGGSAMRLTAGPPRHGLNSAVRLFGVPAGAGLGVLAYSLPIAPYSTALLVDGSAGWIDPSSTSLWPFTPTGSMLEVSLPIPADPSLTGLALHLQALAFPGGLWPAVGSNGVKVVLGD